MINFTFQKEISDIPMILPVEMFILEEETAAPEFTQEINEIIPTMQEEVIEEIKETPQEVVSSEPIIEAVIPETPKTEIIEQTEKVLLDNTADEANEFVIEETPEVQKKEPEEESPLVVENDFEIKLKEKPEPREIEQPFDNLEIIVKTKPERQKFNVSTVLQNLENNDEEFKKEQKVTEQKQEEVFTEKTGNTMTISEIDLLKNQLHGCLTLGPQVGSKDIKDLKPQLLIEVKRDRTVKSVEIINKEKLVLPAFRTAAEAAMRAVNNPDCSPLLLPADKYDEWKEINFTFDFSWMFD